MLLYGGRGFKVKFTRENLLFRGGGGSKVALNWTRNKFHGRSLDISNGISCPFVGKQFISERKKRKKNRFTVG